MSDIPMSSTFYNTVARYYDAENEFKTDDLALYSALAEAQGEPILVVGCGTGRVMLHLAAEGRRVAGLDISQAMLERGRRKLQGRADLRDRAVFYEGSALDYILPERYRLILIPYNTFMHFRSTADQLGVLRHLARFLDDDGLMVFDLPNAGETFATADDSRLMLERSFVEPESGNLVMQQSVSELDRAAQMQYITWIYDEIGAADGLVRRTVAPLALRYVFPAELDLLLQAAGLGRTERYGDYDQSPFENGCPHMIVLARKP
jgi:SAM-dependent methyltransferase